MHSIAEAKLNLIFISFFWFDYLVLLIWSEQFYFRYVVSIVKGMIVLFVPQNKIVLFCQSVFGFPFVTTQLRSRYIIM